MHCIRCMIFKLHVVIFVKRFTNDLLFLDKKFLWEKMKPSISNMHCTCISFENRMRSYLTFHHHSLVTDDYNVRGCLGYWDSFENTCFMFINCSIYSFICGVNVRLVINFFKETSFSLIFFFNLIVNWNFTLISVVVVLHANCCCILRPLYAI